VHIHNRYLYSAFCCTIKHCKEILCILSVKCNCCKTTQRPHVVCRGYITRDAGSPCSKKKGKTMGVGVCVLKIKIILALTPKCKHFLAGHRHHRPPPSRVPVAALFFSLSGHRHPLPWLILVSFLVPCSFASSSPPYKSLFPISITISPKSIRHANFRKNLNRQDHHVGCRTQRHH
jgi:hypothetical protein